MTLDEFLSLKEGDQIQGMTGEPATVTRVDDGRSTSGRTVTLCWKGSDTPWHFNERQTAWMHWTKVESVQSENDASGERTNQA